MIWSVFLGILSLVSARDVRMPGKEKLDTPYDYLFREDTNDWDGSLKNEQMFLRDHPSLFNEQNSYKFPRVHSFHEQMKGPGHHDSDFTTHFSMPSEGYANDMKTKSKFSSLGSELAGNSESTTEDESGDAIEAVDLNFRCLRPIHQLGGREKSPVLLLHGLGDTLSYWDSLSQVIARRTGRKVCAVDLRNHGDSPYTERFDLEALTADIAQFLKKTNTGKVNIIGHSIGGKVAVHYTLKNPDNVDSLVVEDMRPNGATESATNLVIDYARFRRQAIDSLPEGINKQEARKRIGDFINQQLTLSGLGKFMVGVQRRLDYKMIQNLQIRLIDNKWEFKINTDAVGRAVQQRFRELITESKGLYEGPNLFIYGTESLFDVGGDEMNIKKLFPNAKLIPVKGAGHLIHEPLTFVNQFQEEVIKFLNGL